MNDLNSNMVKLSNDLKAETKTLVNNFTEVAVSKLTTQAQANMIAINRNVTALITNMKEASRNLMLATGHT
eukprot:11227984-Ditylum_brightwellii.AAC.1